MAEGDDLSLNPPRDAAAPEGLRALRRMDRNLAESRSEIADLRRQVAGGRRAPGAGGPVFLGGQRGVEPPAGRGGPPPVGRQPSGGPLAVRPTGQPLAPTAREVAAQSRYLDLLRNQSAEVERQRRLAGTGRHMPFGALTANLALAGRYNQAMQGARAATGAGAAEQARFLRLLQAQSAELTRQQALMAARSGLAMGAAPYAPQAPRMGPIGGIGPVDARHSRAQATVGMPPSHAPSALQGRGMADMAAAGARTAGFRSELQRTAVAQQNASQAMRKHGALTTEYITALGRGETTLAEFRWQMTATIGKFAGWTAAAGLVYGALGAIRQLGTGAIESLSGVQELSRYVSEASFDPEAAQSSFRDLSRRYNVPIAETAEASQGAARVFSEQNEALKFTETLLAAVKVGDLEAADAANYFAGIVRGAGADADEAALALDRFNEIQNQTGLSTRDSAQGVARAAGAYRAAGGDLDTLIPLLASLRAVTGETGNVVGTAIARSSHYFRREGNKKTLREFGIDPEQSFPEVFKEALALAPSLSGQEQARLAGQGLSSPQYGRLFAAILQQPGQYERMTQIADPQTARGSAGRELQIVLATVAEQVKAIGTELGNLGSNLAQSGVLDVFGLMLKTLDSTLFVANALLDIFNMVPEPMRKAVVYAAQLYATMALLRRSGITQGLAERTGIPALGMNAEGRDRRAAIISQRGLRDAYADRAEQASGRAYGLQIDADTAHARSMQQRRLLPLARTAEERAAINERIASFDDEAANAAARSKDAMGEYEIVERNRLRAEKNTTDLQKRRVTTAQLAQRGELYYVGSDKLGTTGEARAVGRVERPVRPLGPRSAELRRQLDRTIGMQAAGFAALGTSRESTRINQAGRAINVATQRSIAGITRTTSAIGTAGRALRGGGARFGRTLMAIPRAFGPLDAAIAAFFIIPAIANAINDAQKKRLDELDKFFAENRGVAGQASPQDALRRVQQRLEDFSPSVPDQIVEAARTIPVQGLLFPETQGERERRALEEHQERLRRRVSQRNRSVGQGRGVRAGVSLRDVNVRFAADAQQVNQGIMEYAEFRARFGDRIGEIAAAVEAGLISRERGVEERRKLEKVTRQLAVERGSPEDLFRTLMQADPESRATGIQGIQEGGALRGGVTGRESTVLARTYIELYRRFNQSGDPNRIQEINRARDAFWGGVEQVQTDLQRNLGATRQPRLRRQAYREARAQLARRQRELQGRLDGQNQEISQTETELARVQGRIGREREARGGDSLRGRLTEAARTSRTPAERRAEVLRRRLRVLNENRKGVEDQIERDQQELRAISLEMREAEAQEITGRRDLNLALNQSTMRSEVGRIRAAIRTARANLRTLASRGLQNTDAFIQEQTDLNNLLTQESDALLNRTRLIGDLRASRVRGSGPGAERRRLAVQIQTARQVLRQARNAAQAGRGTDDAIIQAETELNNLINQRAEQTKQRAEEQAESAREMARARFEYRLAGIIEPINRLRAQVRFERSQLQGTSGRDRIEQMTRIREREEELRRAVIDEDLANARFQHDMERTSDDQYATELRRILRTKRLGKEMRRSLLLEIKRLEDESEDFAALDVGNVRLPTLYEVRRATAAGAQRFNQVNNTTVNVEVNDPQSVARVAEVMDRYVSGSGRSMARAAGMN